MPLRDPRELNKLLAVILLAGVFIAIGAVMKKRDRAELRPAVNNFEECAKAGHPVRETFPRQCAAPDGRLFIDLAAKEPCAGDKTCREGFYCRGGFCQKFEPETRCRKDDECMLVNRELYFSCCYLGACQPADYSEDKWVAVSRAWFEQGQQQVCPRQDECGPAPRCPNLAINKNYKAYCVVDACEKKELGR